MTSEMRSGAPSERDPRSSKSGAKRGDLPFSQAEVVGRTGVAGGEVSIRGVVQRSGETETRVGKGVIIASC